MRLHQTCGACPEQYDVYHGKKRVGYLRLRHGYFTAEYLDVVEEEYVRSTHLGIFGELVYEAQTKGDGSFHEDERGFHLDKAIGALQERMRRDEPPYKT